MMTPVVILINFILKYRNIFNFADSFSLERHSMNNYFKYFREKYTRKNSPPPFFIFCVYSSRENSYDSVIIVRFVIRLLDSYSICLKSCRCCINSFKTALSYMFLWTGHFFKCPLFMTSYNKSYPGLRPVPSK